MAELNHVQPPRRRGPGRPFAKGQSGNPGGKPRAEGHVRELARQYGPEAIARLVTLMRGRDEKIALAAAQALLDRGYGRPAMVDGTGQGVPLVNIDLRSVGAPITNAEDAARVYAEVMRAGPEVDLSAITFAPAEAARPAIEAQPEPIAPSAASPRPGSAADALEAEIGAEADAKAEANRATWEACGK